MIEAIASYIQLQPRPIQERLSSLHTLITRLCPSIEESMIYGSPAYRYKDKPLVYIAWYNKHIGFYATPSANLAFVDKLKGYKTGKWSIQFPHRRELPLALIEEMIIFKIQEIDNQKK